MINAINVFTDGGARGNPGEGAVGVYIEDESGQKIASFGKRIGITTNNIAEYRAVLEALAYLLANREKIVKGAKILFHLDSKLVCSQLNGIFKIKDENLRSLFYSVKEKGKQLISPIVYTHIAREENKKADSLVNLALDSA